MSFACPACNHLVTAVKESRQMVRYVRRRRQCVACRHPFATYEIATAEYDLVAEIVRAAEALSTGSIMKRRLRMRIPKR